MKKKRILLGIALASASIFALASCGSSDNNPGDDPQPQETDEQSTKATVTFNTNGGNTIAPQELDKGDRATQPDNPTKDGFVFLGWYTTEDGSGDPFDFTTAINANITLYAKWKVYDPFEGYTTISNKEEFNAFRTIAGNATGNYVLTADIDLEGEVLDATTVMLYGTFDGNGHTIKNARYVENASNKTGILCRELLAGKVDGVQYNGCVKNVKFSNCTASINNETIGIVSGMCGGGEVTISSVEFSACTVECTTYPGLLTGRINYTGTKLVADQITAKNGCRAKLGNNYGGFLLGDIAGGKSATEQNELIFTNMDIAGEIKGGSLNGSFVFGRIRNNTKCTMENSVIRDAQITCEKNDMGLLAGGGTTNGRDVNVNYKNVAVLSTNASALQSLGGLMKKSSLSAGEFLTTYNLDNVYLPQGSTLELEKTKDSSLGEDDGIIKAKEDTHTLTAEATPTWLKDTIKLDFTNTWMTEGENNAKYRLKASSTNVKSANAKIVSLKVTTANATTRFTKGTDFSADGLVVAATYSDDVQLILSPSEYEVVSTTYDKETAGTYTITVNSVEQKADGTAATQTYDVTLAEQTGVRIDTQFATLVYTKGQSLDLADLLVYSVWSDGIEQKEATSKYTVDSTAFNKNAAGAYNIAVSMTGFPAQNIKANVVDSKPVAVDNNIYINVDANATITYEGQKVDGVETFKTVTNAIDYLVAANLGDVNKVIYIADGVYFEKITVPASLKNLKIIGQSRDNTIIRYDAVEGTLNPLSGSVYKMDCATLHVNATGFGLENITVENSFDYIHDASNYGDPQGFALTIAEDGAVLNNVHLYGNQDTLFFKKGRTYIIDSIIEGNVDFIFGENNGLAFFEGCLINSVYRGNTTNNGYVTAMKGDSGATKPAYGYIFNNCAFTADGDYTSATLPTSGVATKFAYTHNYGNDEYDVLDGAMSLGRPWGAGATITMTNCSFTAAYSKLAYTTDDKTKSRWFSMSGNVPTNADFSEYNSSGDGAITEAVTGGKLLTAAEAANYTAANLFAATNGGVTWTSGAFDYAAALTQLQGMATKTAATDIVVSTESIQVERNKTAELIGKVTPWNANNKDIQVEIGNDTICSYDGETVTGIAVGNTTITFTLGTITKVVTVEVIAPSGTNTVTFMDGTTEMATKVGAYGDTIDFTTIDTAKSGYQFARWYVDAEFTKEFTGTTIPDNDITVYARYIELNKTGVTYVSTADQLVAAIAANETIYLTSNIDMSSSTYGGSDANFTGSVYGYGYTISGWTVAVSAKQKSFFGKAYAGTVEGVVFKDFTMTIGDTATVTQYVSLIFTQLYTSEVVKNITLTNCVVDASSNGAGQVGLLFESGAGKHNDIDVLTITNLTINDCTVKAGQYSGGVIARLNGTDMKIDGLHGTGLTFESVGSNCKNAGGVIGHVKTNSFELTNADIDLITIKGVAASSQNLGGVAYVESGDLKVTDSKLNVVGIGLNKVAGGIAGLVNSNTSVITITDVELAFNLDAAGESIGGLMGRCKGTLTANNVSLSGTITANYRSAGLVGYFNDASAAANLTDVSITNLTITNTNADNSGNTVYGKSDMTTAPNVTGVSYAGSKVSITLGGTAVTTLQGTNTEA